MGRRARHPETAEEIINYLWHILFMAMQLLPHGLPLVQCDPLSGSAAGGWSH
jgi:hypothetical protein